MVRVQWEGKYTYGIQSIDNLGQPMMVYGCGSMRNNSIYLVFQLWNFGWVTPFIGELSRADSGMVGIWIGAPMFCWSSHSVGPRLMWRWGKRRRCVTVPLHTLGTNAVTCSDLQSPVAGSCSSICRFQLAIAWFAPFLAPLSPFLCWHCIIAAR